ncbi:hypothetical protein ACVWYG_002268 [Pedobacter sp. UYEF25]
MVRKILLIAFILLVSKQTYSQNDSSSYKTQRVKINSLLNQRSLKFGQYDESLKERSGIFGLQTKKDLRKSNDILRTVVLDDNQIFREIKSLMEYKDLQNQQKVSEAGEYEGRMIGYMHTVKKLQDQQKKLQDQLSINTTSMSGIWMTALGIIIGAGLTFGIMKFENKKASNEAGLKSN